MKNKGMTLIEVMFAVAILAILALMVTPLYNAITKAFTVTKNVDKFDLKVGRTVSIIKRAVSISSNEYNNLGEAVSATAIYLSDKDGKPLASGIVESSSVMLNVPYTSDTSVYVERKVLFSVIKDSVTSATALYVDSENATKEEIKNGVAGKQIGDTKIKIMDLGTNGEGRFYYQPTSHAGIMAFFFKVENGDKYSDIRDAAVTKINIGFE